MGSLFSFRNACPSSIRRGRGRGEEEEKERNLMSKPRHPRQCTFSLSTPTAGKLVIASDSDSVPRISFLNSLTGSRIP